MNAPGRHEDDIRRARKKNALIALGLCLAAGGASIIPAGSESAAHPAQEAESTYRAIESELSGEENQRFSVFYSTLTHHGQMAMAKFTNRLGQGQRGLFALLLLESEANVANDLLALIDGLNDAQLDSLAAQLGERPFEEWQLIPDLLGSATISEVRDELFPEQAHDICEPQHAGAVIGSANFDWGQIAGGEIRACSTAIIDFRRSYWRKPLRVIKGQFATPGQAQWQAQLALHGGVTRANYSRVERNRQKAQFGRYLADWEINHTCGAVYIGGRFLLTAAHCIGSLQGAAFFDGRRIRLGTHRIDGNHNLVEIRTVVRHAQYDGHPSYANDIALVQLLETPRFPRLTAARLPTRSKAGLRPGSSLLLTGWGYQRATEDSGDALALDGNFQSRAAARLLAGNIVLQRDGVCNSNPNFEDRNITIRPGQLCAGSTAGVDSCRGDSGGPIVHVASGTLVGLVSYGPGCGLPNTPGVYVDVGYYSDWIARAKSVANAAVPRTRHILR